jgi:predicted ester cyclase
LNDTEARKFLEDAFATLFDPKSTEEQVQKFFSPKYVQDLNGKLFTFREFFDGVSGMKKQFSSFKVKFTSVVSSGNTIAEVHVVQAFKSDGSSIKFKVIALQTVDKGRIVGVEEVNCPL